VRAVFNVLDATLSSDTTHTPRLAAVYSFSQQSGMESDISSLTDFTLIAREITKIHISRKANSRHKARGLNNNTKEQE
jgi:hypothetical protein